MAKRKRSGLDSSFIAIMRGDLHAKNLRVPPKFMKYLTGDLNDTVTLITNSATCWRASVTRSDETIYLKGGWENFFTDHSLGHDELLAFTYKGNMHFHVQIFDAEQCQRTQNAPQRTPPPGQHPQNGPSPATVESFTSSFPHLKICLRKSSFHPFFLLHIPLAANIMLNFPLETTNFIMRREGRVWDVKCLWSKAAGHHRFSKGWRTFALDNELKPGDICIFELVASCELLVTICRSCCLSL